MHTLSERRRLNVVLWPSPHLRVKLDGGAVAGFGAANGAGAADFDPRHGQDGASVAVRERHDVLLVVVPHRDDACGGQSAPRAKPNHTFQV